MFNSRAMVRVHDVAAFILRECGRMSTMKLQKLAYYAQCWTLVHQGEPLFADEFQAWIEGPVCPALYDRHRGQFHVSSWPLGNPDALAPETSDFLRRVLGAYSGKSGRWLSDLTHRERPWVEARAGLASDEPSRKVIGRETMKDYYAETAGIEARIVSGQPTNPIFDFIETMSEDEASLVEKLAERDLLDPIDIDT
jgi:uncharacterized phage-associated protein